MLRPEFRPIVLALLMFACHEPAPNVEFADLADYLSGAEVRNEPALIDFGTPEGRAFLESGWSRDETHSRSRETFVWSLGGRSELSFFLGWNRDLTAVARCRPFRFPGAQMQRITVELNAQPVYSEELHWGIQEIEVSLPAEVLRAGENSLAFIYGGAHAPVDVVPGAKDQRQLAVAWYEIEFRGSGVRRRGDPHAGDSIDREMTVQVGSTVDLFIDLPARAELHFGEIEVVDSDSAVLTISLLEDLGEETKLVRLMPPTAPSAIELKNDGGPARIRIETSLAAPGPAAEFRFSKARIFAPEVADDATRAPAPLVGEPTVPEGTLEKPNVVIYLVDALRADRLGCYGSSKSLSPRLDEFAREAVVFEDAVAQSSWTKAAVASLFTGLWPVDHGTNGPEDSLPPGLETLPEILGRSGYRTAAVSANAYVNTPFGFARGFDDFVFSPDGNNDSTAVNDEAFKLVDTIAPGPFFLYLHAIDPHAPYSPPEHLRRRFAEDVEDPGVGEVETVRGIVLGEIQPNPDLVRDLEALYDAEVAANDAAFGALIDTLKTRGLYEKSLICFVADHGEAFGEHGTFTHGIDLYPEVIHVPMVVRFPGGVLGGHRVTRPVQQTDLTAAILRWAGIALPGHLGAGRGLVGSGERSGVALSYLDYWGKHGAALVSERWKLVMPLSREFGDEMELFDRRADPGETVNLVDERPVVAGLLASELRRRMASPEVVVPSVEVDVETRRNLEALGYVAGGD